MLFRKKIQATPTTLDRRHALSCIPIRNPEVEEEMQENGELRLCWPVEVKPWFQGVFKRFSLKQNTIITRKLQLDTLGVTVWKLVDGKKSVGEIVAAFRDLYQLEQREAEIAVTSFFKELGRRGLVAMRSAGE
ncbi:PqqD family protein [Desulfolithobacter sp.]